MYMATVFFSGVGVQRGGFGLDGGNHQLSCMVRAVPRGTITVLAVASLLRRMQQFNLCVTYRHV
jgi:hypothetical protein